MGVGAGPSCRNCGTPLAGEYCARCGQRDVPVDPTLRELVAEAWEAFAAIDGKVLGSLRLLVTRPGALTTEYLAGRRAPYLPPLRLYLVCSVLYFLVSSVVPDRGKGSGVALRNPPGGGLVVVDTDDDAPTPDSAHAARTRARREKHALDSARAAMTLDSTRRFILDSTGRGASAAPLDSAARTAADSLLLERKVVRELGTHPGWFKRVVVTRFIRNAGRVTRDTKGFGSRVKEQVPRLMFVLMPVYAALLALAYRSRRRRYPTHLIVSLHVHAFAFAVLALVALVEVIPVNAVRVVLAIALTCWMVAYVPLALRRVYGGRLRAAIGRTVLLFTVYAAIASTVLLAAALAVIVLA